jgi:hypothetical protein
LRRRGARGFGFSAVGRSLGGGRRSLDGLAEDGGVRHDGPVGKLVARRERGVPAAVGVVNVDVDGDLSHRRSLGD